MHARAMKRAYNPHIVHFQEDCLERLSLRFTTGQRLTAAAILTPLSISSLAVVSLLAQVAPQGPRAMGVRRRRIRESGSAQSAAQGRHRVCRRLEHRSMERRGVLS